MFLCIDTVSSESSVALAKGSSVHALPLESSRSSEAIFGAISTLFEKAGAEPKDLKGVVVVRGPGSFTSIRVGIATANPFAHQLGIPIVGLTTDEWFRFRTSERDFAYLQTMNRDEAYAVGFGKLKKPMPSKIVPVSELVGMTAFSWIGSLNEDHRKALAQAKEIKPDPIDTSWGKACAFLFDPMPDAKAYQLAEPYYGKEPKITPSKRRFSLTKQ